jgi:hypothetical protein
MAEWTERAELLFKKRRLDKLQNANVLVVGLGGVGSLQLSFWLEQEWDHDNCRWRRGDIPI